MPIKESSDELNPSVVTVDPAVAKPQAARSAKDYLALAIATCGVGYLPLAPGTWGSLLAIGVYLLLRTLFGDLAQAHPEDYLAIEILIVVGVTLLGVWAASQTERILGTKDPGKVVIDEVAGQLIALMAVSLTVKSSSALIIVAFALFRFFDIIKPYPARKFESLHGGWGIMLDDIVAGIYAAVVIILGVSVYRSI